MKQSYFIFSAVAAFVVLNSFAFAESGKLVPYVSIKQEYSDNILFVSDNEQEDYITTSKVGAITSYKTERVNAKLDGNIYHLMYWDNDQLDDTNGAARSSIDYQVTEKIGFGAAANYRKSSRRDADTDTTGLLLTGDREQTELSVSSSYQFTETSIGQAEIEYGVVEIDETNSNEDNDSFGVNLGFSKNLSKTFKNTTGLLNFSYMRYSSEQETIGVNTVTQDYDSDVFQLYGGFEKNITELYSFYLQAGASYTDTTEEQRINSITIVDQESDTWGGVLLSGLNYDGLYWDFGLSASHDVRGSSGSNGTVERSSVSLDIDRKITEDFSLSFNVSCYLNKNERQTQSDLDELTVNIQPGFHYHFLDTFSLQGIFRHTTLEDREDDTSRERNLVYLVLRKNFDLQ